MMNRLFIFPGNQPDVVRLIAILTLAVGLQVLFKVPIGSAEIGIVAADFLLVGFIAVIGWQTLERHQPVFRWRMPLLTVWLAVFSVWMTFALINGYWTIDSWFSWAVVNRWIGWFVLLGYLIVGGWIAGTGPHWSIGAFVKGFIVMAWVGIAINLSTPTLSLLDFTTIRHSFSWRGDGLLGNPNSFGLVIVTAILLQIVFQKRNRLFSPTIHTIGILFSLVGLFHTSSRGALISLGCGLVILLFMRQIELRSLAKVILLFAALMIVFALVSLILPIEGQHPNIDSAFELSYATLVRKFKGIDHRLILAQKAIEHWSTAPFIGTGLGTFYWDQLQEVGAHYANTIHNTFLWLLAETGIVGMSLMVVFFFLITRTLLLIPPNLDQEALVKGMLGVLSAFLIMSLANEVLYQRYLWVLLGMSLAARPSLNGSRADDGR